MRIVNEIEKRSIEKTPLHKIIGIIYSRTVII